MNGVVNICTDNIVGSNSKSSFDNDRPVVYQIYNMATFDRIIKPAHDFCFVTQSLNDLLQLKIIEECIYTRPITCKCWTEIASKYIHVEIFDVIV